MAALTEAGVPKLIELRHIRPAHLEPLLEEETVWWRECLDWDFGASADLVRRFIGMRALAGHALLLGGELVGYTYHVSEESKGLVGDLYVRREYRCQEYEDYLLEAAVGAMMKTPHLRRVESQLMLLENSLERTVPYHQHLRRFQRNFMAIERSGIAALAPGQLGQGIRIEPWTHKMQEAAALLIAEAYYNHIDGDINDQYRSPAGARRFLINIVQYPGCGAFFPPGSSLAIHEETGELAGLSLASLVSDDVGHITQICVSPRARRQGIGYEVLRASLQGLLSHGCRRATLTVTATNAEAGRLYERMGFRTQRRFAAYVWEGFR